MLDITPFSFIKHLHNDTGKYKFPIVHTIHYKITHIELECGRNTVPMDNALCAEMRLARYIFAYSTIFHNIFKSFLP
jgi:hypothetical protein